MSYKTLLIAFCLCLCLVLAIGVLTDNALAKEEGDWTEAKGIEGLFSNKKDMEGKGPTRVQKYIGFGSILVMFAVVKWL